MIGRVYQITNQDKSIVYIGSTVASLGERWSTHKKSFKKGGGISIYSYFSTYGINSFSIHLIKEYQVVDGKHLKAYEQLWINKTENINMICSFQPLDKEARRQATKKSHSSETYKNKRKESRKKKYTCTKCNLELLWDHKSRHERSIRHLSD